MFRASSPGDSAGKFPPQLCISSPLASLPGPSFIPFSFLGPYSPFAGDHSLSLPSNALLFSVGTDLVGQQFFQLSDTGLGSQ